MKKPISTNKAPAAIGPYSQAIQWGDVVFISGQVAFIPGSGELNNNTFEDEVNQVIDNLDAICKEAGGGLDNILKLSIFLTDLSNLTSYLIVFMFSPVFVYILSYTIHHCCQLLLSWFLHMVDYNSLLQFL